VHPDEPVLQIMTPPHSIEAEQSLLGALMLDNQAFDRVISLVGERDFYRDDHRRIFAAIELLLASDKPADMVTVCQALEDAGNGGKTGGAEYLAKLAQNTPSALNIRLYAELVKEKSVARNLLTITTEVGEKVLKGSDITALLEEAESRIFQLRSKRIIKPPTSFPELLSKVYQQIDHRYHRAGNKEITGIPTSFKQLDAMTAGLQRSDLIIVAGRPSMGKTAIAMNIAEYAALEKGIGVAIFSIEMSDEQLVQRMLGSVGRVDQLRLRTGQLTEPDWEALSKAMETLSAAPFFVEETSSLTIMELRARARRLKRENPGLGLIIVDYLQLMATQGRSQSDRTVEVGDISRGMKALAKELDIPVMALSQLNRGVDARVNKRPLLSDLRESGSIEQDADLILFLYRDEVYTPDTEWKGYAEAIIGKQRNGPVGTAYLRFVNEHTRFENPGFNWTPPSKQQRSRKKKGFDPEEQEGRKRADIDA
jgi:replicative DNA helicase